MAEQFEFEEITNDEKKILLSAFGYSVDDEGYIIDSLLNQQVISPETKKPFTLENATFVQGSLKIIDSDPLTISRYLREEIDKDGRH